MNPGPAIVLVRPQLAENIGMAARAMLNCGLADLRLVRPRPTEWPHPKAIAAATGADAIVRTARVFERLEDALADLHHVFATCPRERDMIKPVLTGRAAAQRCRAMIAAGERPGLLFGPERTGLENDEVALADTLVRVPLNPEFDSLNLAQAVLLIGYEWWIGADATPPERVPLGRSPPATKEELLGFFRRLEAELDASGFLRNADMRPRMVRNLRNIFHRAELTANEVRTLHGVVSGLARRPHGEPPAPESAPTPPDGIPGRAPRGRAE